jgi:hypothetical protein
VESPGQFQGKKNPNGVNKKNSRCKFNHPGTGGQLIYEMVQSSLKERDLGHG